VSASGCATSNSAPSAAALRSASRWKCCRPDGKPTRSITTCSRRSTCSCSKSLTLRLGDRRFSLACGYYVCFPAGQKLGHALINETDEPCRYLVFGNPQPHDVAVYPDSGRVSVKLTGEGYRQSATMDYWDGLAS